MSTAYVAVGYNQLEPDVAFGPLTYRAQDPEVCKRLKATSGAPLADVIIDVVAYRQGTLVRTSFLRTHNNQWVVVTAMSARIFLFSEQYDQDEIEQLLRYE